MAKAKDIDSKTLSHFLGDDELPTENIDLAKQHAMKTLGKSGRRVVEALERLEKKKKEDKEKKPK
ncbi:MAG: hypothetical protein V1798_12495 [Pseudomonadota bacterium]